MTRRAAWTALLAGVVCASARAQLYPPAAPGLAPKGVPVIDEHGRSRDLADLLRGRGPVILLPVFTRCAAVCPLLIREVKSALVREPGVPFRVVVFSFDAADGNDDLLAVRRDLGLPADWWIVRAAEDGGARDFLDQFGYVFMQKGDMFVHPSEMFVLSAQGRWSGTFAGGVFPAGSLKFAARQAEDADSSSAWRRWRRGLSRPEAWAMAALGGLALASAAAPILSRRA